VIGLQKTFTVHILLSIVILLSFALITACEHKKESKASVTEAQTALNSQTEAVAQVQNMLPRLVDLGADECIPCKMMAPILKELKQEYAGELDVEFIDVWKNPSEGRKYGIRAIPTRIFYDAKGNELYRHIGFFSKEDILAVFSKRGIDLSS
jgi:thioredoxin 1